MYKYVKTSLFFIIPFLLDRLTKYWIVSNIITTCTLHDYCNFFVTSNRGIAWGIGSQMSDISTLLLNIFIAMVLLYFVGYLWHMSVSRPGSLS